MLRDPLPHIHMPMTGGGNTRAIEWHENPKSIKYHILARST